MFFWKQRSLISQKLKDKKKLLFSGVAFFQIFVIQICCSCLFNIEMLIYGSEEVL